MPIIQNVPYLAKVHRDKRVRYMISEQLLILWNNRLPNRLQSPNDSINPRYLLYRLFFYDYTEPIFVDSDLDLTPSFYKLPNISNFLAHDGLHHSFIYIRILLQSITAPIFFLYLESYLCCHPRVKSIHHHNCPRHITAIIFIRDVKTTHSASVAQLIHSRKSVSAISLLEVGRRAYFPFCAEERYSTVISCRLP